MGNACASAGGRERGEREDVGGSKAGVVYFESISLVRGLIMGG